MARLLKKLAYTAACLSVVTALGASFAGAVIAETDSTAQVDPAALKSEIEKLRNEKDYEAKRAEEMRKEREQFVKEIRRVENLNSKYSKEIEEVRAKMTEQEKSFEARLKTLESSLQEAKSLEQAKKAPLEAEPLASVASLDVEKKANEVLQKGGDLDPEDEKFKEELARAHYNMGNVYFDRGEYQRSVVEYYQAVDLMPYDADAHYNLAFVSGDYIGDQETALKHYQWYLYLKPNAADKKLIEEKIVGAKLKIRSQTVARIDKPEMTGQLNVAR